MTVDVTNIELAHSGSLSMPSVGMRCEILHVDDVYHAASQALKDGCRLLDTTWLYNNEEAVGRALKESGIGRDQVFLTAKLWSTFHRHPEKGLELSLKNLGTDYLDLFLVHWPVALKPDSENSLIPRRADGSRDVDTEWTLAQTWAKMQQLVDSGKVRAIGVANVASGQLEALLQAPTTTIKPAVVQVELHPFLPQKKLLEVAKANGIIVQGYCPTSSEMINLLNHPTLTRLATQHGATKGEILAAWMKYHGGAALLRKVRGKALPKLNEEEFGAIDGLYRKNKQVRILKPDWNVEGLYDELN
uniref:ARAD1A18128p n=1 Tax=Blastobotrys adeninivorans TaxID=409370 RepID=A0A060SZ73_BLAAD